VGFAKTRKKYHRLADLEIGHYVWFKKWFVDGWEGRPYNQSLSRGLGGSMYAVIKTGGKQYRVAPGDTIRIERVKGDVGEQVKFGTVLAVQTEDKKMLAGSDASQATVTGKIVEQGRAKKLTVLKYKKTNQYKIQRGHRQNYTAVQVSEIKL
jgi:large subunit ribosomal protein L21